MNRQSIIVEFSMFFATKGFTKGDEAEAPDFFGNWTCDYFSDSFNIRFSLERGQLFLEIQDKVTKRFYDIRVVIGYLKNSMSECSVMHDASGYRIMLEENFEKIRGCLGLERPQRSVDELNEFDRRMRIGLFGGLD